MTWRRVDVWEWTCDRCDRQHLAGDEHQPEGWTHTMLGEDLCARCTP